MVTEKSLVVSELRRYSLKEILVTPTLDESLRGELQTLAPLSDALPLELAQVQAKLERQLRRIPEVLTRPEVALAAGQVLAYAEQAQQTTLPTATAPTRWRTR